MVAGRAVSSALPMRPVGHLVFGTWRRALAAKHDPAGVFDVGQVVGR